MDVEASFGHYYGFIAGYYFSDIVGLELNMNEIKFHKNIEVILIFHLLMKSLL